VTIVNDLSNLTSSIESLRAQRAWQSDEVVARA
jgi:hypothetical protein